jgi:hypothetical protein
VIKNSKKRKCSSFGWHENLWPDVLLSTSLLSLAKKTDDGHHFSSSSFHSIKFTNWGWGDILNFETLNRLLIASGVF